MNILVANAWPYANGPLHIGHIAALLPGDVIARYHRLRGNRVHMVSGSDCHGTPVSIRAQQEGRSPQEISDFYHDQFDRVFRTLGFSYDRYGKTSSSEHMDFVTDFHRALYREDFIYEKSSPQAWCESCGRFLADRFVMGVCPGCGMFARGDQCEACGQVLEPERLREPRCSLCGHPPAFREARHLYLAVSRMERELTALADAHPHWRKNAAAFTRRYIGEGLRDRAVTRDLDWGIDVPHPDYGAKKIYIWAENVLGYLSMSKALAEERGEDFADFWSPQGDCRHYYVHGKDNIPFHTIILPALLIAHGDRWRMPDDIISSEYLTLEGRKISTSENWAIWAGEMAQRYHPDSIRYFLIAGGPEKRDTDFSWREFVNSHNGELLGAWGNLVNRTLVFIRKYRDGAVPQGRTDEALRAKSAALYLTAGALIERGDLKDGLESIFTLVREGNRYFDARRPWETRESDPIACDDAVYNCIQLIGNLSNLLEPFLPFTSARVREWLGISACWEPVTVPGGRPLPEPDILFERLEKSVVGDELARLNAQMN